MRPRFRYPAFKQVLWYAAAAFARRLQRLAGLSGAELRERVQQQLTAWAEEEAAAAATRGDGSDGVDSDSVSKAGAAKKKKGWLADDAGTRLPRRQDGAVPWPAEGTASPAAAGLRTQQPPALARQGASPTAAAMPRQIGRAVGGGSRLRKAGGGGGGGGVARGQATRLNPTQAGIDMRGGGGGGGARGGGGGGGFARRKRQRSPDSFIEQDSADEVRGFRAHDMPLASLWPHCCLLWPTAPGS